MAACQPTGFDVTGNSAIRPADSENPTLERNMKCIRSLVAVIWLFAHLGAYKTPFGEGKIVGVSDGTIRKSDVSYRLSIVTAALSVTIRPEFAIECLRRSNQQGVGHFGPKFPSVPLGVDPQMFGFAKSEHPRLTNVEIISEEFQPM